MMTTANALTTPAKIAVVNHLPLASAAINKSWAKIAPFWPLKNLIAVNPIAGFEDLAFEEALTQANAYFQQKGMPVAMQHVNRESIKWLQVFFDQGQSTIGMPLRDKGLLKSTLTLLRFDNRIHKSNQQKIDWLEQQPDDAETIIQESLLFLGIKSHDAELFLTLMLTTLPGWAAYIKYRTDWADSADAQSPHPVTQSEYLAFRLVLTSLIWPEAKTLLDWHKKAIAQADTNDNYSVVVNNEKIYQQNLIKQLSERKPGKMAQQADAQLVFCIDVRSEPFRRAVEAQGNYETYGFAGFFGVPVSISNAVTGESYPSCPVLLKPAYDVTEQPTCSHHECTDNYLKLRGIKKLYQSLKYTFTTPFALVETLGLCSGLWMGMRSLFPDAAAYLKTGFKKAVSPPYSVVPDTGAIPFDQQVAFAAGALKMMGLTEGFAPLVLFCGHGSETQNNAYATALDCGACGGRHGAPNARILASILNNENVRAELAKLGINISNDTTFLAAEHNTTTDEVQIWTESMPESFSEKLNELKGGLEEAKKLNSARRSAELGITIDAAKAHKATALRARDWAEVRPEWGLAKNAAFIVGPRWLTKGIDLGGRSFLHSYEWEKDSEGTALTTILTAPMVVAQWINAQYFFSTADNVAFGGGSKITKNITGKLGIMQGNASDLMHGLPLQSVFKSDKEAYHKPLRLTVVVYAPKAMIDQVISKHPNLQKLFRNGWVHMICYDPHESLPYKLKRTLQWANAS